MGIKKALARKGAVGSTARWAAKGYHSFIKKYSDAELSDILRFLVSVRYGNDAKGHEEILLNMIDKNEIRGLAHFVILILTEEAGFSKNTEANQALFRNVIVEELESHSVPDNIIHKPQSEPRDAINQEENVSSTPSLSFEELEALSDVLEAARCYWNKHPLARQRAESVLQIVNRLYWRLGEELPKIGVPSARFQPVRHSSNSSIVNELVEFTLDLVGQYNNENDPWCADTVLLSRGISDNLSSDEFIELESSLERLGMVVLLDQTLPASQMTVVRSDIGPWPELAVKPM